MNVEEDFAAQRAGIVRHYVDITLKRAGLKRGRGRPSKPSTKPVHVVADPLLTAKQSSAELNISSATFYRAVRDGQLPPPTYVRPGAPRWRRSTLHAAVEVTAKTPSERMAERQAAKVKARLAG